jgi:putative hydrolase of the HAD superfamily
MIIIFDLGGVFVKDSTEVLNKEIAEYIGLPETELVAQWTHSLSRLFTAKMTIRDFYAALLKGRMDPGLVLEKHLAVYQRMFSIDPFMLELLTQLKKRHVTACLTNTEVEIAGFNRQKTGLFKQFHHAFLSTEMGLYKPGPEIFLSAMKALGVSPEEVIFVDDKAENIRTAHSLGIRAIQFIDGQRLKNELSSWVD